MTIEAMGTGLKTRLDTISSLDSGIWAPNEIGGSIPTLPWAIILQGETLYHQAFGGAITVTFRVLILFGEAHMPSSMNAIIDYTERSGANSVLAAIEGDRTLGSTCDDLTIHSNSGVGTTNWGGTNYISTEFIVECQLQ